MTSTELCERRLLPLVMAFAVGALAMRWAADSAEANAPPAEALDTTAFVVGVECVPEAPGAPNWRAPQTAPATVPEP